MKNIIAKLKNKKEPFALLDNRGNTLYLNNSFTGLLEGKTPEQGKSFIDHLNIKKDTDQVRENHYSELLKRFMNIKPLINGSDVYGYIVSVINEPDKETGLIKRLHGAAHDLNNINSAVLNSIELLKDKIPAEEDMMRLLYTIERNSLRSSEIIENILIKRDTNRYIFRKVRVDFIINELAESLKYLVPPEITLTVDNGKCTREINADPSFLYRALLNISVNAREAITGKGKINISVKETGNRKEDGDQIEIIIRDTGSGIKEDHRERIFEPYFTTKKKKIKSGLGLDIVKEIVETHKGLINVESEPGKGTEFRIILPVAETVKTPMGKNRKILIADDEASVRELLAELLDYYDYKVLEAVNGQEVINLMGKTSNISLLIIDKKMPGIDGVECIRRLREEGYKVPIVLASGNSFEEDDVVNLSQYNVNKILTKPYNFDQLKDIIEEILG